MNGTGLQQWLTGTVDVTVSQAAGALQPEPLHS